MRKCSVFRINYLDLQFLRRLQKLTVLKAVSNKTFNVLEKKKKKKEGI